ncbi:MAG: DUF1330 domain-containing protein [bacterium]
MPAYMIARIKVTDPGQYKKYIAVTPGILANFGGKFIARGGETVTLEGPEENSRVVLVEFPSFDKISEFYNSAEYQEAIKIREGAAEVSLVGVAGI